MMKSHASEYPLLRLGSRRRKGHLAIKSFRVQGRGSNKSSEGGDSQVYEGSGFLDTRSADARRRFWCPYPTLATSPGSQASLHRTIWSNVSSPPKKVYH